MCVASTSSTNPTSNFATSFTGCEYVILRNFHGCRTVINLVVAFVARVFLFEAIEGGRNRGKLGKLVTTPLSLHKDAEEDFGHMKKNDYS
ncbi:hypothetical protein NPIL_611621 [Nephila pilipes]|uniref:Uncharacterized protein n=1 Tax=Nephila pilipes TaxID=299642 RepID=A0A8X6TA23_NEPPI|nr:hypothetical protein NPIL_611621 [Nephila pilipes]